MYNGKKVTDSDVEGFVAFVYVIENIKTGRKYIGKKRLTKKISRKPLKGKKRKRVSYVESDWKDYWGSNETLLNDIQLAQDKKFFKRKILRLCKTISESSYYEAKIQFVEDVLLHPDKFYNEWIMVKIRSSHLRK